MNFKLNSQDPLTQQIKHKNIATWQELLTFVQQLPYGRNSSRTDFQLVLTENRGTCSTKHAFLKQVADLNTVPNVHLILGMYKMSAQNTPQIAQVLTKHQLAFLPEAHCYLMINDQRLDLTNMEADISKIEKDIIEEQYIAPLQVGTFKVNYHQEYLRNWLTETSLDCTFEQLWQIRERCIACLASG